MLKPLYQEKSIMTRKIIFIILILPSFAQVKCQDSANHKLKPLMISSAILYGGSLVALDQLWYADFEREGFHFFNDNNEWNQVDKIGHFYSAFQISHGYYRLLKWADVEDSKAIFWGTMSSFLALTPIEIFDGFSSEYGASTGDFIANTSGAALFYSQLKLWDEIRIHPKFSFHRTDYPNLRPEVLGKNINEELFKDYNAHTYWLSVDLSKFNSTMPKWLNIAVGYGAENMIYANNSENKNYGINPARKFLLGLDFDLNEFKSKSKLVNTLIYAVNLIRIPSPALEFKDRKFRFYSFYY